jgi:hypothetical protein
MPFFALGYVYVRQRLQAGAAVLQIASDGQINSFRAFARKGPMNHPFLSSFWMILSNSAGYSLIETLFGGVCTVVMSGKSNLKPKRRPSGILAKRSRMPAHRSSYSQAPALYGVSGHSLLCTRALLSSMLGCSTARTDVASFMFG